MPPKKQPERMCSGCGAHKPKNQLIRVVRGPEGEISLDFTGKKPGRGAYLCHDAACLKKARKTRRMERSLDTAIPDAVYLRLEEEMNTNEQSG